MKGYLWTLSASPCICTETITMTFSPGVSSVFVLLIGPINKRMFYSIAFRLLIMRVNNRFVSEIKATKYAK